MPKGIKIHKIFLMYIFLQYVCGGGKLLPEKEFEFFKKMCSTIGSKLFRHLLSLWKLIA